MGEKLDLTPKERIDIATHLLEIGVIDAEEYLNLTGIEVRDELKSLLKAASKSFMPLIPLEQQAQIRLQHELAALNKKEETSE